MESLLPSSVCLVIRSSSKKVRQCKKEKQGALTPPFILSGRNQLSLDEVFTKDGCNLVPQPYGFFIRLGILLALVLESIRAHLLAKC